MQKLLFSSLGVAAIFLSSPLTVAVKADDSVTITDHQKKDNDSVTIKEREKTEGRKDRDDVIVKEREAPKKKDDDKIIIKDK